MGALAVKVNAACPVCGQTLSYEHTATEAWGAIGLTDFGIVEITAHDGGQVIGPHMQSHYADGSWEKALRQRGENWAGRIKRLDDIKADK